MTENERMKNNEFRYSDEEFEFRASDSGLGVVSGVIVRYGDVAKIGMLLTEEVEKGTFTPGRWWANRMHQRADILGITGDNLTLIDDADALRFRLELPPGPLGIRTAYELAHGQLLGASIELGTVTATYRGTRRVITKSTAVRFALVDEPAYPDSKLKVNRWQDWEGYEGDEDRPEPEGGRAAEHGLLPTF